MLGDITKIENNIIYYKRLVSNVKKFTNTFCMLKHYRYIELQHIQSVSYPTDRTSMRLTNSIWDSIEQEGLSNTKIV